MTSRVSSDGGSVRQASARGPVLRIFFALVPDATVRDSLAALAHDVARETGGRAPRDENVHLTLAFLGNVPRDRLDELTAIGAAVAAAEAPFPLTLDTIGAFRDARVAWAGPAVTPAGLERAFARLRVLLQAAGLPTERRPFNPHVTLARHCVRPPHRGAMDQIAWRVESIALMASETLAAGPRYAVLASWPLAGAMPLP